MAKDKKLRWSVKVDVLKNSRWQRLYYYIRGKTANEVRKNVEERLANQGIRSYYFREIELCAGLYMDEQKLSGYVLNRYCSNVRDYFTTLGQNSGWIENQICTRWNRNFCQFLVSVYALYLGGSKNPIKDSGYQYYKCKVWDEYHYVFAHDAEEAKTFFKAGYNYYGGEFNVEPAFYHKETLEDILYG